MPRVTVLVPNFNGGTLLDECLDSVQRQSFGDWCVVIGDNGSIDGSAERAAARGDHRVRVVTRPHNVGWVTNMNLLLDEVVDGDVVAILHSDDWWEPDFLRTTVELLDRNPSALVAATGVYFDSEDGGTAVDGLWLDWPPARGELCASPSALRSLTTRNRLTAPAVVARRPLYDLVPRFDPTLPYCCDWLMWLRAARVGDIAVSGHALAHYRVHAANLTAAGQRAGLWALDKVRMHRIVLADWARDGEPYPGAARQWTRRMTAILASMARECAERDDREGALFHARLAQAVAPTMRDAVLCRLLEATLGATTRGPLNALRGPMLRAGERVIGVRPTRRSVSATAERSVA